MPFATQAAADFAISDFDAVIEVHEDASFTVTEVITGVFFAPRHGLTRTIPVGYTRDDRTDQFIKLDVERVRLNGEKEEYETRMSGPYTEIRIGEKDKTMDGPFRYEIVYRVRRAMLYHDLEDELYWNVTGDVWKGGIQSATATVLINGVAEDDLSVNCYTGKSGSTAEDCATVVERGTVRVHANDFLTLSVRFPKNVVREPGTLEQSWWWLQDNWGFALAAFAPLAALVILFGAWLRTGRDPKPGTVVAEYEPPEGLRPAEVGTLLDAQLHHRDFSATIVDLAVRGYVRIEEVEFRTLEVRRANFKLHKLKVPDDALERFERVLLIVLFGAYEFIDLSQESGKERLAAARKQVRREIYAGMAAEQFFIKNPQEVRAMYSGLGGMLFFVAYVIGKGVEEPQMIALTMSLMLTGFICILFAAIMPKKTEKGALAFAQARGFKLFLETAERDRLKWQAEEGLFEKFLPYAIVFGVVDRWSKVFAEAHMAPPAWYAGNFAAFNATALSDRVEAFSELSGKVSAPKSSRGRGGRVGGGFGGGGGGSW
jgi:hypothetical protein